MDADAPLCGLPPSVAEGTFWEVEGAILLSPRECTLSGQDAEDDALEFLCQTVAKLPAGIRGWLEDELGGPMLAPAAGPFSQFHCRTYLRPQTEVKQWYVNAPIPRSLQNKIARLCLPKYVWVTELSDYAHVCHAKKENRARLGEVIVDSTAPGGSGACLLLRLGRFYFIVDRDEPDKYFFRWFDEDDAPVELPQYAR